MLYPTGAQVPFLAQFTTGGAGAAGLTVTVSVVRLNSDGTRTVVISRASNTAATEVDATNQPGLYSYLLAGASTGTAGVYLATFHTAGTCDLADVPALEIVGAAWVQAASVDLDATVSSRLAAASYTAPSNATIAALRADYTTARAAKLDNLDAAISTRAAAIGAVYIAVTVPVPVPDAIPVLIGDDYGPGWQAISVSVAAGAWPDFTGGTVELVSATMPDSPYAGTIDQSGPAVVQVLSIPLDATQTGALSSADYPASLVVTVAGQELTVWDGAIQARARAGS